MNPHDQLETIKTIARMAASVCQTVQAELVVTAQKSGREPVTIADYASQAVIGNALAENFPDDAVLAEERSEEFMLLLNDEQRALVQRYVTDAVGGYVFEEQICAWLDVGRGVQADRLWVVDPIDGTKGFMGQRHYCVAIALLEGGEPVLGVLASPAFYAEEDDPPEGDIGALIYARQGAGAYCEALSGSPATPVQASRVTEPGQATLLTSFESGHSDHSFFDGVGAALGRSADAPQRRLDSQDKYGMVAAGMGDVYLRLVPEPNFREKMWDHAAGYAIVTEAGGRMTDIAGNPIDWTTGTRMTRNRGVLVTNRYLHDAVLAAIHKTGVE